MWAYGSDELKPTSKNIKANEGGKQIIYLIGRAEMITFLVSVFSLFLWAIEFDKWENICLAEPSFYTEVPFWQFEPFYFL